MKAVDIKWDTDGDNELLKTLPKEMGVPEGLADDRISDYLSDVTGFCHHGFALEETNTHPIPIIPNILSQADRSELFGLLVDAVEDWLDKKGITPDMIPNDEREDEDSAIIYGSDYDYLADRFSEVLGIERDIDENTAKSADEIADNLPEDVLEAAYRKRELQYRMMDAKNHAEDLGYEISDEEAKDIAQNFLHNIDCNVAENDLFEEIVEAYVSGERNDNGEMMLPESVFDIQTPAKVYPFDEEPDYEQE